MNNLIICTSPFQLLLINKILDDVEKSEFVIIYNGIINSKVTHYIQKFNSEFREVLILLPNFYAVLPFLKRFYSKPVSTLYCASIDNFLVHFIIQRNKKISVFTFDDGLANIDYEGHYYSPVKYNFREKIRRLLFGIFSNKETVKTKSTCHYTIFPGYKNIVDNTVPIQLFSSEGFHETREIVHLLLGQPLFEKEEQQIELINRVCQFDGEIKYYYPHPKEITGYPGIDMIASNLLFEEYLLENSHKKFVVYTFFSTAAVNVKEFPNVEVIALYSNLIPEQWHSAYSILEKFDIPIVNIDEVDYYEQG